LEITQVAPTSPTMMAVVENGWCTKHLSWNTFYADLQQKALSDNQPERSVAIWQLASGAFCDEGLLFP
jgi:hypothetical protein